MRLVSYAPTALAIALLVCGCSSSDSSGPSDASNLGDAARETSTFDTGSSARDSSIEPTDTSSSSGFRCYLTASSCICLDPAPSSYTATTCSFPCCYLETRGSPKACNCAAFTGSACDDWIASAGAPRVDHCPD